MIHALTTAGSHDRGQHGVRELPSCTDGRRQAHHHRYAHQARFLVRPGQRVSKGDPIGIVGATGYATGPHLHFEVRENGTVVDPMRFVR